MGRPELARLVELTRLELVQQDQISYSQAALIALRGLRLQELVLLNCHEMELKLLLSVPGALTTLRKLHIEDPAALSYQPETCEPLPCGKQKDLKSVGAAIFGLPELQQLSGWCDLFAIGMRHGLRRWKKSAFPEGFMVTFKRRMAAPYEDSLQQKAAAEG